MFNISKKIKALCIVVCLSQAFHMARLEANFSDFLTPRRKDLFIEGMMTGAVCYISLQAIESVCSVLLERCDEDSKEMKVLLGKYIRAAKFLKNLPLGRLEI